MTALNSKDFISWFRSVAPYVHMFRGRTLVIACSGEVLTNGHFVHIAHDLNLLSSLGIRLVLVHGARRQVEKQLRTLGVKSIYSQGLRVTDHVALECLKNAVGTLRVEIEAALSQGLPNSPMENAAIRIASGNFVTAQPLGVLNGIDFIYTGKVRKIDVTALSKQLEQGNIVLLSPIGYSPTGEVFNLSYEDVATSAAIALRAAKLIFLVGSPGIVDKNNKLLHELTAVQAEKLSQSTQLNSEVKCLLPHAVRASRGGVARAHMVNWKTKGALLLELFTHTGVGSMITQDTMEQLRQASIEDVGGILQLIEPLEAEGVLVKRSRERLEIEIDRFMVIQHDQMLAACAALYPFSKSSAELACLGVHLSYRNVGYGERLLKAIESKARSMKIKKLFVLTTVAAHWFIEHGFKATTIDQLPEEKQALYNYQRRSKVFVKKL